MIVARTLMFSVYTRISIYFWLVLHGPKKRGPGAAGSLRSRCSTPVLRAGAGDLEPLRTLGGPSCAVKILGLVGSIFRMEDKYHIRDGHGILYIYTSYMYISGSYIMAYYSPYASGVVGVH